MSIEAMKMALEFIESTNKSAAFWMVPDTPLTKTVTALRAAIEQAEKQEPFGYFQYAPHFDAWVQNRDSNEGVAFYTAPRQEPYDQTALELCEECGWRAMIPGDGCLVCARQKAKPVWIPRVHLEAAQREPSMCRVEPTNRLPDFVPLYTAPPPRYRRGTYVRCMESDELCRVYTTSIDGGAWVRWPDGSITTYTAEQMGKAFSLEQAAPGKPVAYADERIHGWPDCFVMEPDPPHTVPLYTDPREWVGLTDEERAALLEQATYMDEEDCEHLLMLAEAKLKEKNAA